MDIKELIVTGARCIDEQKGVTKMINVICRVLIALSLSYAAIFYLLLRVEQAFVPAFVAAAIFVAIRRLNRKGYTTFAVFALVVVNSASIFYFSAILGIMTEALMLIFFFIGIALLFFKSRKHRSLALGVTLLALVSCEINFYFELVPQLAITRDSQFIIRWLTLSGGISLDALLLHFYALKLKEQKKINSHTTHELKAPLNAMMLILDEMKGESEISPEQLNDLIAATTQCRLTLENELTTTYKMTKGHAVQSDYNTVHIRPVIDKTLDLNEYIAKSLGVNLVRVWGTLPEWIATDENKIIKIVNNLVTNALKFTPKGKSVIVEIDHDSECDYWKISVTDQGLGISKENLNKIFQPYFTFGGATEGTGLGLTITEELVKSLGGTVTVDTSTRGSRFTVSLPLVKCEHNVMQDSIRKMEPLQENESSPLYQRTILLVEDDMTTQKYFGKLLLRMGATVSIVSDVKRAIDQAALLTPEIILLDLNTCAELSGVESIRALSTYYPDAEIVAVSGDLEELDKASMASFATLKKPLVPNDLSRVVRSVKMPAM